MTSVVLDVVIDGMIQSGVWRRQPSAGHPLNSRRAPGEQCPGHRWGGAEVVGRFGQRLELGALKDRSHVRLGQQRIGEGVFPVERLAAAGIAISVCISSMMS